MDIVNNTALRFRTRNVDRFKIIPMHLAFPIPGGHEVYVHWDLDECRVLKNMGFKVPSPIEKKYTWPGRYTPMGHQKTTAGFLTLHRRAFCFNDPGCVDSETEYLSPTGWKRIADYTAGEVAQYHPDTGAIDFVAPEKFVKLPCKTMVHIKTKYGVDQMLSPEHRMVVRSTAADYWCETTAEEMQHAHDDWHAGIPRPRDRQRKSIGFTHAAVPTAFDYSGGQGLALSDAALRVQVAVIADGHLPNKTCSCVMRLKRPRKVARMHMLLAAAGIEYKVRAQDTATAQGFHVFTFQAPLRVKEFDARFWDCSRAQRNIIAEEVLQWDGTVRGGNKGGSFCSTSKASADFVQFVRCATGRTARVYTTHSAKYKAGVLYTVQARGDTKGGKHGLLSLRNRAAPTIATTPSTDGFKYCFMVPSTFLVFRRKGCVFGSGNTAKTMSALWAADYLMQRGEVRRCLIVCPLSIMHSAWMGDITNSVIHRTAIVAHHAQASRRIEMIQGDYEFVIINYDGLNLVAEEIVNDGRFDLVIVDEANCYAVNTTRRWKSLAKIIKPNTFLWMMTGTPAAQSPVNAYGLAKLVNPTGVPNYFTSWRDKVMWKVTTFKWAPKPEAKQIVFDALQPAIRFSKAECLDLPPVLKTTREVAMTPQQQKYYKKIKDDMLVVAAGQTISAVNKAAVVSKLLQCSAGGVYSEDGNVVEFDATPRMNLLLEILQETSRKVIIFAMFRSSIDIIHEFLNKNGHTTEVIDGRVTASKRGDIISRFQFNPTPRVLVMQPQATAHGITLTAADTVVFFGPLMSVELYSQAIARSDRKGQTAEKVTVIHIQSSPLEKKMFEAMDARVTDHALLTQMFDEEIVGGK